MEAPDPLVGRLLGGQYLVRERIGEGGMGTVYLVEHTALHKAFAAKVLHADAAHLPDALARFEAEATAASRLDHDNIINVVHFGRSDDGTVFLVMELLRGETLDHAIARGPLGLDDVVRIAVQICDALDAAHAAGIVHRDLKPENVFVSRRGGGRHVLKLLDFGISRIHASRLEQTRLTQRGEVLGSPLYMSPEACVGALDLDARADVYAVGVMLYELVTGEVPFVASNALVIMQLHVAEPPPPPSARRPELPAAFERVILRALAKDRDARFGSARAVAEALVEAYPVDLAAPLSFVEPSREIVVPGRASVRTRSLRPRHTTGRPRTNLAASPNRFIGRPREVAELTERLRGSRLVTLTGAGGVGKTRLAAEVAQRVLDDHAHGAWLVELAALREPALVEDAIAQALGFGKRDLVTSLTGRPLLLVLDNCEHLIGACAAVVERLLRECPRLTVLATSREPLGIAGEALYRVPPLSGDDAASLFVERARAAAPDFAPTPVVSTICARLDGMPLALELAAARVRTLSLDELHARLDDRFRVLTGGSRTALPRHQTLRALIDWSHELLDEPARIALRRLAVFDGGFSLGQAEAVVGTDDVLDQLTALVDRSLVIADTAGASARYRMLETIRQYACEKLAQAGELDALRARHRVELVRHAEALAARYADSAEEAAWFDALAIDHDNLRAAMAASLDADDGDRLVAPLRRFWLVRGHFREARGFIDRLLARVWPDARRLALLDPAVTFATAQQDFAPAEALLREVRPLARALDDRGREAQAITQLAFLHFLQARFADADPVAREAVELVREGVSPQQRRFAHNIAGLVASRVGDHARAIALLEACVADARAGSRQYYANILESLGTAYWLRDDDHAAALPLYREATEIFVVVGDLLGQLSMCERFAQVAARRDQVAVAARLLAAAAQARERLGSPRDPIDVADCAPALAALASLPEDERAAVRPASLDEAVALGLTVG